jgi:P4 family phage/plasmid primase-like protien
MKENIMKECLELFYIEKFEEKLDANPHLIGFENGVFDLENMEFREGRPEDYISFSTRINYIQYNPRSSQIAAINHYLSQVFTIEHMRDYVMKLFASFLTGILKEQKFYIWTGSGANSKSALVNLFEDSFGDYCCKFPITLLTQKRAASNAATSELARAKGKRFGCLQEPSEDEKLNIGLMKELSGGDKIMARAIYKEPVEFRPMFKLLLLCNQLPNVPSDDGGTWRRIRVVEFTSKFLDNPKEKNEFRIDYDLPEKMKKWHEHFMALMLQYYKKYQVEGLIEPEEVLKCTMEYKAQNDHIALYLLNRVEKKDSGFLAIDDIYSDFRSWVREDGIVLIKMPSKQEFEKYLGKNLTKMVQFNGIKGFKGFRLKPMALDDMDDAIDSQSSGPKVKESEPIKEIIEDTDVVLPE